MQRLTDFLNQVFCPMEKNKASKKKQVFILFFVYSHYSKFTVIVNNFTLNVHSYVGSYFSAKNYNHVRIFHMFTVLDLMKINKELNALYFNRA